MSERLESVALASAIRQQPFAESVLEGLSASPRKLSCCWFYDERGSALFEQICELEEYYLTRAERQILERYGREIVDCCPHAGERNISLVELGSGSSVKTTLVIEALLGRQQTLTYHPIDINGGMLRQSALALLDRYPTLSVRTVAADYLDGWRRVVETTDSPRLVLFLGSSIGNFELSDAAGFLGAVARQMGPEDRLLLGADLKKDPQLIEAAYNDALGVTAEFNKNILVRINRELGGGFALDQFTHHAPYLSEPGRVEMRLMCQADQEVAVHALGRSFQFRKGEHIWTESCHKYSRRDLEALALSAGFCVEQVWQDLDGLFSLSLLSPIRQAHLR